MKILRVLGILGVVWLDLFEVSTAEDLVASDVDYRLISYTCKDAQSTTPLKQLRQYLFCNYDPSTPSNGKTITTTNITLLPRLMEYTEYGIFTLHNWLKISWYDNHLTWEPAEYSSIEYIHVKTYELWTPDLCVYNSGNMGEDQCELPTTDCIVFFTGRVLCVPAVKYTARCSPDYTYWPYDKHKCSIVFGSWINIGEEIDFRLIHNGIKMTGYEKNSEWDLKFINISKYGNKRNCCQNDTFLKFEYEFELTRHYGSAQAAHVTPAIVLTLVTLTVLWLDSKSIERMAVASVNFICHLLCIHDLHWILPYNGVNSPHILLFYRESLALATFALFLTVLLRKLQHLRVEMPSWMSSSMKIVLSNKVGRFLILNNEESATVDESITVEENSDTPRCEIKAESSWRHFAAAIEWLSFFCVVLVYIIIFITLVPIN